MSFRLFCYYFAESVEVGRPSSAGSLAGSGAGGFDPDGDAAPRGIFGLCSDSRSPWD